MRDRDDIPVMLLGLKRDLRQEKPGVIYPQEVGFFLSFQFLISIHVSYARRRGWELTFPNFWFACRGSR